MRYEDNYEFKGGLKEYGELGKILEEMILKDRQQRTVDRRRGRGRASRARCRKYLHGSSPACLVEDATDGF